MTVSRQTKAVLVAGAGPTGLMLANCLAAYGVPFDIVDRKAEPSCDSKALAINILSQYALALIGKGDALGEQGRRVRRANVFWNGTRLNAFDFRWLDFELKSFVTQPQAATERELAAALPRDVEIAWRTELVESAERGDHVHATFRDAAGRTFERAYDYVVGCEGKNSLVRESIGAKLEGWDYPMHFLLGDFPLAWDRPSDQAYYYAFEETFFVIVPVSAGYWRVVVKRDGPFDPAAKIEANDIRELAERYLPTGLLAGDPIWLSGAPFYMRMASSLQRGRRFLCGDAAHLFSPIGGTGMNTGMMDAFDLAWRLAYVHHGHSTPEAVLPSYGEERSEAIERGAAAADAATRLIARIERAPERIAPMLPSLRGRRLLRRVFPFQQAGLGLEYSRSSIIRGGNAAGAPRPGTMCLGLLELRRQIEVRTGKRTPLLETSVLIFVAAESLSAREVKLRAWLSDLSRFGGASLGVHIIAIGRKLPARSSATLAIDDVTTLRRLGARDGAVLAIRPDGIIAFSGDLDDRQALLEHLGRWLVSASAEVTAQVPMVASNASG